MKYGRIGFAAAVLWTLLVAGCGKTAVEDERGTASGQAVLTEAADSVEFFAMDTYIALRAYGERCTEALTAAREEIERLDAMLSTGEENSEVARINRDGEGMLSSEGIVLLEESMRLSRETEGAFDIAIYPIMEAWGFTGEEPSVPGEETIKELLPLCDVSLIDYDAETGFVSFRQPGVKIDFGGIAKGYASSRLVDIFREYGLESGYVDLGGNIQTLGTKTDGEPWRIGITNPEDSSNPIGVLLVQDEAVITSGGYERFFEENGTRYHHIIDPATGRPANHGLISVTIVSGDGMLADGLSTSLYIMGTEKAIDFCIGHEGEFDAVLMAEDGTVYVTKGVADRFISETEFCVMGDSGEVRLIVSKN